MAFIEFKKSHNFLDSIGIERLSEYKNNIVVIEKIDFSEQEKSGNIKWNIDGVYLKINNNPQRGFMYIKNPDISQYGNPKFHILECKTIKQQIASGRFKNYYFWSNSSNVTLMDRSTQNILENITLDLCYNCQSLIKKITGEVIGNTADFHKLLDINDSTVENGEKQTNVDIYGRPLNWRKISKEYREERDYICEECGFGGVDLINNYDKRYIHTHHINSYDLLNTHRENLKALCILCHYSSDEHHKSNFDKPRMKIELKSFISKYSEILLYKKNKYISYFL